MISATVIGNVGRDAQLRMVGDQSVLSFSVASTRHERGAKVTDWVDVSMWGERGNKIVQYVTKGSRVAIRGTLYVREYDAQGQMRSILTLRADDIELLGDGRQRQAEPREESIPEKAPYVPYTNASEIPF